MVDFVESTSAMTAAARSVDSDRTVQELPDFHDRSLGRFADPFGAPRRNETTGTE